MITDKQLFGFSTKLLTVVFLFWIATTLYFLFVEGWHLKATSEAEIICDRIVNVGFSMYFIIFIILLYRNLDEKFQKKIPRINYLINSNLIDQIEFQRNNFMVINAKMPRYLHINPKDMERELNMMYSSVMICGLKVIRSYDVEQNQFFLS